MVGRGVIDEGMRTYYEQRAAEYDDWWLGRGVFASARAARLGGRGRGRARRGRRALAPARVLDVACGTGFVTRHLRGEVTGLDQSETMVEIAASRLPDGRAVRGDAVPLPFADDAFHRVFTGTSTATCSRTSAPRSSPRRAASRRSSSSSTPRCATAACAEEWQERKLNDGSRHRVYKRFFTAEGLASELGGGRVLHAGTGS